MPPTEPTSSEVLGSYLRRRLGTRIRDLTIESNNETTVVHGRVTTYYALQLTIAATKALPQELGDALPGDLELAIRVNNSANDFRSVLRKHWNGDT